MTEPNRPRLGRPPDSHGVDTRAKILDKALALFASKGFQATTVREIGKHVGISDSAIYRYFVSKRELYDTLMQETGASLMAKIRPSLTRLPHSDPEEALPVLVGELFAAWDNPRVRMMMSVVLREELHGASAALQEAQSHFIPVFREWQRTGQLRELLEPEGMVWEFAAPLLALRMLYLNHSSTPMDRGLAKKLAADHVKYFVAVAVP